MAVPFPGTPLFWLSNQFFDNNGVPLALGYIDTFQADGTTPQATYSDALLTTANPTTIDLDASGRPTVDVFLAATGYVLNVYDANAVLIKSYPDFENPGQVFAVNFGRVIVQGPVTPVTSGYTIQSGFNADWFVLVDGTGGANPCVINLPAASDYQNQLTLKNLGNVPISLVPDGSDTIEGIAGAVTIPAAGGAGLYPSTQLVNDGISAWWALNQSLILT